MEFPLNTQFVPNFLELIDNNIPHDCSKSVSVDVTQMLSNLPLMRHQDDPMRGQNPNDLVIQSYLTNALQEIAEIRNCIKSISPLLRNSQQIVQNRVFAYARNHVPYSRRFRSLRSRKSSKTDDNSLNAKSIFARVWYRILRVMAPVLRIRGQEVTDKEKVKEAFQNFYTHNGVSYRTLILQTMARCRRLEGMLANIRRKIKYFNFNSMEGNDCVAGIAYQLGVHRGNLSYWKRDFDYVWKQARSVRRLFGLVPVHNCWEAIFNIMTSQGQLNHYV